VLTSQGSQVQSLPRPPFFPQKTAILTVLTDAALRTILPIFSTILPVDWANFGQIPDHLKILTYC